jgi:hypothetical protein
MNLVNEIFSRPIRLAGGLALTALVLAGCGKSGGDPDDHPKPAADAADKPDADATPGTVIIDDATFARVGLAAVTPVATNWPATLTAYGQVLDPAVLTQQLMDLDRAGLALDRARTELKRDQLLKEQNNLSEKAFQDADTAYRQSLADLMNLRFQVQTNWGERVAQLTADPTDSQLKTLTEQSALIRVDLPAGTRLAPAQQAVTVFSLADGSPAVAATCFDRLPTVDPQAQEESLLCVAARDAAQPLIPGEAITAQVPTGAAPLSGVVVPAAAVLRYQGAAWVYVQTATNRFTRTLISLEHPAAGGWLQTEGLTETNHIIVTGAQTVLSHELSSGGFTTGERD